ncbi:unnamed protein product [Penicillium nalgiovense]|uniref:Myb-like domain-containing protein n=1 Tax=Penicillium nalgiovense TaxID=60175 RepID=A0A9W4HU76_PENNA|nr:unnamed protein product [Penicillium nalgiovense]CAG7939944.1 unnamed protein product [Penicillium nalgiovense]CAG7952153.1 unnamed protein product [Penicillium nalgiovense]CAG7953496.1 unnamed protein product [Penicillium nalgiovense]CAG7954641.1 unnamed protein product [Penicillium nalgiovense]
MVSIDLDNIIHYHPAPIPKPACKPPHLTTSRGSSHPPSNQPVLIHPLPPRPPCLSHESPQTCHPRRQSPSPAVSSVPRDRDAHLNEFDKELANLEMAEFGSQETPGLCFGGSEETQAEDINDIQRKELHDRHGASHSDDRFADDSRILSEDPATPQDTAASSDSPETDPSSAASAPTCTVEADGSVSPNEPCPVQDPTPTERNETQLSAFGCETEVNIVVAGNVSSDQAPSPNPSTSVPAGDEPEPANQRLFRRGPETGAESRKSSPLPVTEAYSIQLDARDLSATRDSHLEVQTDGNDIHSTDCCPDYEALSSTISPVLQQKKQEVSRSEGKDSPRNLSRSCSVSVVVPITRSRGLPMTRSTKAGSTRCTGKRKNRAKSACNVESDDPDDSDYTDGNDSGVGDITRLPRLRKRQRRTATTKIQPAQARHESPHCVFSSPGPEEEIASPCPATNLQDIQTIPVRGFLTRQTFLSRVIYSCTFQEDRQASCPHGPTKGPAYDKNLDNTRHATQSSSKKQPARATRFLPDEDDRLIELKEQRGLPWSRIVKHFPGRTKGSLQVRYSTRLKDR